MKLRLDIDPHAEYDDNRDLFRFLEVRPIMLDLFCGVGGAGMGYARAGWSVIGVDIEPQPNYPFTFIEGDAMEVLSSPLVRAINPQAFHASPPCQAYSPHVTSDGKWSHGKHKGFNEPKLIADLRTEFRRLGKPYVIENVFGAREEMENPVLLCGAMFGNGTRRHRLFESSIHITQPAHPACLNMTHPAGEAWIAENPKTRNRKIYSVVGKGRQAGTTEVWKELMGMPWAKHDFELSEAIPPSYTEYIGKELFMNGRFL